MIEQKSVGLGQGVVAGVFEFRRQLLRRPAIMLSVTRFVKERLVVRLSSSRTNYQSHIMGHRYRHAKSSRILSRTGLAVDDDILLRLNVDSESSHRLSIDFKH